MTLLEKGRVLARAWSVQLAAIGAALSALFAIDPAVLQAGWQTMPPELRAVIPHNVNVWISLFLFVAVIIARAKAQPQAGQRLGLLSAAAAPAAWLKAVQTPFDRAISSIAIHCSATPEGKPFFAADIRGWHKRKGWADIGYHFVIDLDGTIEVGRPLAQAGAHVQGFNAHSIGVCYVGGVAADGKQTPKDTRTPAQKAALVMLLRALTARFPGAVIKGHRDYSPDRNGNGKIEPFEWVKVCPSFDARTEYKTLL